MPLTGCTAMAAAELSWARDLVCCGGLVLFVLLGSAGFAAIATFLRDPVVQAVGLAALVALLMVLWSRRRSGAAAGTRDERSTRVET